MHRRHVLLPDLDCWSAELCGLPCSTAIHESAAATGRAGGAADLRVSPTASAGPRVPLPHVPRACPRKAPQGRPVSCPSLCRPDCSLLTVRIARLAKSVGGVVWATHNLLGTIRASNLYKCSVAVCIPLRHRQRRYYCLIVFGYMIVFGYAL